MQNQIIPKSGKRYSTFFAVFIAFNENAQFFMNDFVRSAVNFCFLVGFLRVQNQSR